MGLFTLFSKRQPVQEEGSEQRSLKLFNDNPLPPPNFHDLPDSSFTSSENALAVAAFQACVRAISESVAGLPWGVYKRTEDANTPERSHPYQFLIGQRPNRFQTSYEFRETMVANCCIWGNSFAKKTIQNGLVTELTPIHPLHITPRELKNGEIVYDYFAGTKQTGRFTSSQIVHMRFLSENGWRGLTPINLLGGVIRLARTMDAFAQTFWEQSGRPSVILESSQPIPEDAMRTLASSWRRMFAGPQNAGKSCVLPNGITVKEFGQGDSVGDTQLPLREFIVAEIARAMRVPMSMIGGEGGNFEDDQLRFAQQTITPWVNRVESAFQRGLFEDEKELNNQLDLKGMMRGDSASRASYYGALFNMAALSPNDLRRAEELPPIETEAANEYYIPMNNFSPIQWAAEHGIKASGEGTAEDQPDTDAPASTEANSIPLPEGGPNGETLQEVSLNGAQVSGIIEILAQISAGLIDKPAGKVLIEAAFPSIPSSMVSTIVDGTNELTAQPAAEPTAAPAPVPQEPTDAKPKATRKKATKKKPATRKANVVKRTS